VPQFTVYTNPGSNQEVPFVVQVQATYLDKGLS